MELSVDAEFSADEKSEVKKWAQIYSHSYNESLTGCVDQLLQLEKFAKAIVGEYGYAPIKSRCDGLILTILSADLIPV